MSLTQLRMVLRAYHIHSETSYMTVILSRVDIKDEILQIQRTISNVFWFTWFKRRKWKTNTLDLLNNWKIRIKYYNKARNYFEIITNPISLTIQQLLASVIKRYWPI